MYGCSLNIFGFRLTFGHSGILAVSCNHNAIPRTVHSSCDAHLSSSLYRGRCVVRMLRALVRMLRAPLELFVPRPVRREDVEGTCEDVKGTCDDVKRTSRALCTAAGVS
eukprot:4082023-Pyramimonas_sp.AAC.1